jgi:hypothetical protein
VRDAGQLERRFVQELLVALDVGHQHLEHVVGLAGGRVAADDLRAGRHGLLEATHLVLAVARQVHLGDHAQRQADLLAVDQRGVAADDARGFQVLDALPHRRARQPDAVGQLLHGLARIALQLGEQHDVMAIERIHLVAAQFAEMFPAQIVDPGKERSKFPALKRTLG